MFCLLCVAAAQMPHLSQPCISSGVFVFQAPVVIVLESIALSELLQISVYMDLLHVQSSGQALKGELLGLPHFCDTAFVGLWVHFQVICKQNCKLDA